MNDFQKLTQSEGQAGVVSELWYFVSQNKKWWLVPILIVMLGFGLLVLASGTAAAPFIYTLF